MAPHPLSKESKDMLHLHICRASGKRIGNCQCATCRLSRGEAIDLPTRQHATRSEQGAEA